MSYRNRLSNVAFAAVLTFAVGMPSWADDTEIFFNSPSASLRPNVLFIIDTSGSMSTLVDVRPPYDPATTYTGTGASCTSSAIYWKKKVKNGGSTPPTCVSNTQYINDAAFVCQTARPDLASIGVRTIGPVMEWDPSGKVWDQLASAAHDNYVECRDDSKIDHGLVAGDQMIPANGSIGPYTKSAALGASWKNQPTYFFYTGNYLNYYNTVGSTASKTRIQIVKDAANKVIDSSNLDNTNVALMRYSSNAEGGMVVYPFTSVETARASGGIHDQITALNAAGFTPLSETLYESYLYLVGGKMKFGGSSTPVNSVLSSRTTADTSYYKRTIDQSCEQTYVIYLTDGEPTQDTSAQSDIESVLGHHCDVIPGTSATDGICLDDLAGYMHGDPTLDPRLSAKTDLYDDPLLTTDEQQEVANIYTIGFGDDVPDYAQDLLKTTADVGGGENFSATDDATLTEAFASIAADIDTIDVTFTSPTVSVNAFNRTRTLDDLFFSVFEPDQTYHWAGNLKKYRIDGAGDLRDADGVLAIDLSTGFFKTSSRSFWSAASDGERVPAGGAANLLATARNIYTYTGTSTDLTNASNAVADANTAVTKTMLGNAGMTDAERTTLISWVRGTDTKDINRDGSTTDPRHQMGDPLHAQPASVIYGKDASSNPIGVVYTATNDGYLHAISVTNDASGGSELWSFIPTEMLPRMTPLNNDAVASKVYGLDGNVSVFRLDNNGDGTIDPTASPTPDKVYLLFGMGRGGRHYYALDVSDKTKPVLKWHIAPSGDFAGLGDTWSTPVVTSIKVKVGTTITTKRVAIFAGGYDSTQDGGTALPAVQAQYHTDTVGNHIYIVDAETGAMLWRADLCSTCASPPGTLGGSSGTSGIWTNANLVNSIPGDIRVIDVNDDGLADRMYAGDMGGRVWRFDIINGETTDKLVRGGVLASLGFASGYGTNPADARRFYSAPDASLLRIGTTTFMNIIIGSGYRGHPLNTNINDRIYSLRDPKPFVAMTDAEYATMSAAPIVDNPSASTPVLVDVTSTVTPTIPLTASGWKINLPSGEKVLVEAQTFAGNVMLSTYSPTSTSTTFSCSARTGTNRLYLIKALDGAPTLDINGNGTVVAADGTKTTTYETSDRFSTLKQQGIAPASVLLFPSASAPTPPCDPALPGCTPPPPTACSNGLTPPTVVAYIGAEKVPLNFSNCPVTTFWKQNKVD
jgi:type IV pilus assembly protein PilY1